MPAGNPSRTSHAGDTEPRSFQRTAAARSLQSVTRLQNAAMGKLTPPIRKALLIVLSAGIVRRRGFIWMDGSGNEIMPQTMEAMRVRSLVVVTIKDSSRNRRVARLTEIGERIARDLKRETAESGNIDNWQDGPEVYGVG